MNKVATQATELNEFEYKITTIRGDLNSNIQQVRRQGDVLKSQEGQLHELLELIGQHQETLEVFSEATDKNPATGPSGQMSRVEKSLVNLEERATKLEARKLPEEKNTTDTSSLTSYSSEVDRNESDGPARRHIRIQNNLLCSLQ